MQSLKLQFKTQDFLFQTATFNFSL